MHLCETLSKVVCMTRMGGVRLQYKHCNGKNIQRGGVKDMEFSGVLKKSQVDFPVVNLKQCGIF